MASTVKQVIEGFLGENNLPKAGAYAAATSPAEVQYVALLKKIGDYLRNQPYDWPTLKRSYTWTVTSGTATYALPGDFYRMLNSTPWDVTNNWSLRGPMSDYQKQIRTYAVVALQTRKAYRIVGDLTSTFLAQGACFQVTPTPTNSTDQLTFDYVSWNWVIPSTGAPSPLARYPITADTDLVLFDDDLLIAGMTWAYRQAKDMPYESFKMDWEAAIRGANARFNGPTRINSADELGDNNIEWPNVPVGDWNV